MTGWLSGLTARVKEIALNVRLRTVSFTGKCWLAEKCHLKNFNSVLNNVIKVIHHIKAHALLAFVRAAL